MKKPAASHGQQQVFGIKVYFTLRDARLNFVFVAHTAA